MSTYNGWTNYETWCCNLWLTNNEYSNEELSELACGNVSMHSRANTLKEQIQEDMPEMSASLYSDLLQATIEKIDFREIIENHEEDIEPEEDEEEL